MTLKTKTIVNGMLVKDPVEFIADRVTHLTPAAKWTVYTMDDPNYFLIKASGMPQDLEDAFAALNHTLYELNDETASYVVTHQRTSAIGKYLSVRLWLVSRISVEPLCELQSIEVPDYDD